VAAAGAAAALALAACSSSGSNNNPPSSSNNGGGQSSSSSTSSGGSGGINGHGAKVGIILPDTTSSPRWITADPTALKADCQKYNLSCDIQNADGDTGKMKSIAN